MSPTVRCAALAVLLLALMRGEGGAADRDKLSCLKNARSTFGSCQRDAQQRCKTEFDTSLRNCFGADNSCVRGCQADEGRCQVDPSANQEGCKIACGTDLKSALRDCKVEVALEECQQTARVKALKCRQKCTAVTAPAKQRCAEAFKNCLIACASGG